MRHKRLERFVMDDRVLVIVMSILVIVYTYSAVRDFLRGDVLLCMFTCFVIGLWVMGVYFYFPSKTKESGEWNVMNSFIMR